jgi:hypothetical protein
MRAPCLDQRIPRLDQKLGDGGSVFQEPMTRVRGRRSRPRSSPLRVTYGLLFALSLLAISVPFGSAGPAPAKSWTAGGIAWNNGQVECDFAAAQPTASISALAVNRSGMSTSVSSIEEVRASGSVAALARLSAANWTAMNQSTPDSFDLAYSVTAPILLPNSTSAPLGTVSVRVDYLLPTYSENATPDLSSVTFRIEVRDWAWQASGDALVLAVPVWPTFPSEEHLVASTDSTPGIASVENLSGTTREYLAMPEVANVSLPGGSPFAAGVLPEMTVGASQASVGLSVTSSAGEYSDLVYSATVKVSLPSTIAGIPLYDFGLVAVAGTAISIAVAFGARRVRRRPSDLVYAEEEP